MHIIAFIMLLAGGDAVAEAGSAYRQAREALDAEQYEQAVGLLKTAIQQVGEENDQLKYRDDVSRRRHTYYPYYEWGRARLLQSRLEASIYTQRDQLQDAVGRLGQSRHPGSAVLLDEAKAKLKDVTEAIALDGSFNAAKTEIDVLGTNERYVEAYDKHKAAAAKYKARVKELDETLATLKLKQAASVSKFQANVVQRLRDVLLVDPVTRGETIVPMIESVMVPETVIEAEKSGPTFDWAKKFMALWKKEEKTVKAAATLPGEAVIKSADAFDALGQEALAINLPAGFRAARHLAQTARVAKLRDIVAGAEDVLDTKTADTVVASSKAALAKGVSAAKAQADNDTKDTLLRDLGTQESDVNKLATAISDGSKRRAALTAPIVAAEGQLLDGDVLGDVVQLRKLSQDMESLSSSADFSTLTNRLRARAFFAKAIAASMAAYLDAKPEAEAMEAARVAVTRAYGFDPKVDVRWAGRLSTKMTELFKKLKP